MSHRFWPARWFAPRASATRVGSTAAAPQPHDAPGASRFDLEPKIKDVVFVHIPKTAGTSMLNMLSASLPTATRVFEYGADTATIIAAQQTTMGALDNRANAATVSGNFIDAFASDIRTPEKIAAMRDEAPRGQRFLVSSHWPIRLWISAFHPASVVTFLRDPVDRVVSEYRHRVRQKTFTGSFAQFYESQDFMNIQCRQLNGTNPRDLGFVGLFEFMPDMLKALSRHLGVQLRMRHDNAAGFFSPRPSVDAAIRTRILALNEDDLCLYSHVKANLEYFTNHRGRPTSISSKLARGKVYRTEEGTLIGWALAHDPNQLATIEVRVGGQAVKRCYADQFLPWLKKVTPHGVGGFEICLPPGLTVGKSPIRVMIAGTEKDLEGSPLTL